MERKEGLESVGRVEVLPGVFDKIEEAREVVDVGSGRQQLLP